MYLRNLSSVSLEQVGTVGLSEQGAPRTCRGAPTAARKATFLLFVAAACMLVGRAGPAMGQLPSWLEADQVTAQVFPVRVYEDEGLVAEGAGVLVGSAGHVLTSSALLEAGPNAVFTVLGPEELPATVVFRDGHDSGLAVLQADGLGGTGISLSVTPPEPGSRIFVATPGAEDADGAFIPGAVGDTVTIEVSTGEIHVLQHNAMISARHYGSPVIDECGRLVALNVPMPEEFSLIDPSTWTPARKVEPEGLVFAARSSAIAVLLNGLGIEHVQAAEGCATAETRARERAEEARQAETEAQQAQVEAEQAQADAEEAEERARQAQEEAQEAREEIEGAREESERAQEEARQAQERAQQAQVETEQAQAEAERAQADVQRAEDQLAGARARADQAREDSEKLRRLTLAGAIGGGVLLLALLLIWLASIRSKKRAMRLAEARLAHAEREAARAQRQVDAIPDPAPFDCALAGASAAGSLYAINLLRTALGDPAGVVVGRNPRESSHIVADPSVSREHARFYLQGEALYVEDLNSTNGTKLNGERLAAGQGAQIDSGDELVLGSVAFRVDLKR